MTIARDIHGTVFAGGTGLLKARLVGSNDVALEQADVDAITYTIDELDQHDASAGTVVEGHEDVALVVSAVVFDTLQAWSVDDTGYNFSHEVDVSANSAFATRGRAYRVTYRLTPASGQIIVFQYVLRAK